MKKSFLLAAVLVLCGCRSKNTPLAIEPDKTIVFTEKTAGVIPDIIDSVEYLALETCEGSIYSGITKMMVKNNKIYIGDSFRQKIVVFDLSGRFLYNIDKKGRGPGEYLELKNFTVDNNSVYVIDNRTNTVTAYSDANGEYMWSKKIEIVAWDLSVAENGDFMFAVSPLNSDGFSKEQSRHRIFITDKVLT